MRLAALYQHLKQGLFIILMCLCLNACHTTKADAVDSQGQRIVLQNYLGKWIIINYWSTWCKPCLTEMPALNRLQQQFPEKVVVLGISYDHLSDDQLNKIAKQRKIHYSLLKMFPIKKYYQQDISILPLTLIINPKGHLARILKGPRTEKQFAKMLRLQQKAK